MLPGGGDVSGQRISRIRRYLLSQVDESSGHEMSQVGDISGRGFLRSGVCQIGECHRIDSVAAPAAMAHRHPATCPVGARRGVLT